MIEYTTEELDRYAPNDTILDELQAAREAGDEERRFALFCQLILPPVALLTLKANKGADWIRENGINTREADLKFGPDWMERDDEELERILHA